MPISSHAGIAQIRRVLQKAHIHDLTVEFVKGDECVDDEFVIGDDGWTIQVCPYVGAKYFACRNRYNRQAQEFQIEDLGQFVTLIGAATELAGRIQGARRMAEHSKAARAFFAKKTA